MITFPAMVTIGVMYTAKRLAERVGYDLWIVVNPSPNHQPYLLTDDPTKGRPLYHIRPDGSYQYVG